MTSTIAPGFDGVVADLGVDVLSVTPRQLPCVRCGRTLAAHAGSPPDCSGFVRPAAPVSFVYADELDAGDWFRFVTRSHHVSSRVATGAPFDLDPATGFLQLESHAAGTADVIHLIEPNTLVELVGRSGTR